MSVGSPIIYRPPLWSQESEYSAADDRRLIFSSFWPGVIDANDLKVTQRQEGPNMSVDVAPGHVMLHGTEQVDQGGYLCPLAQRVNIPIAAGPAAGNTRQDMIIARVYEPISDEAYWQMEAVQSQIGPVGTDPPWGPFPPSSSLIAVVGPIVTSTVQITDNLISDLRHMARPGSMGAMIAEQQLMGIGTPGYGWSQWGGLAVLIPPYGPPVDIEARLEGTVRSRENNLSVALVTVELRLGPPEATWTQLQPANVSSITGDHIANFSRTLVASGAELSFPDQISARAMVSGVTGYSLPQFETGVLTLRVTPSGIPLTR